MFNGAISGKEKHFLRGFSKEKFEIVRNEEIKEEKEGRERKKGEERKKEKKRKRKTIKTRVSEIEMKGNHERDKKNALNKNIKGSITFNDDSDDGEIVRSCSYFFFFFSFYVLPPSTLRSGTTRNWDVTGQLARMLVRSLIRSFARILYSFAPLLLLYLRSPLRSFVHSLAHSLTLELVG